MLLTIVALGVLFVLLLRRDAQPPRMSSLEVQSSARLIAAARLRRLDEERQERFRAYDRAWSMRGIRPSSVSGPGRGYVVEFRAAGGRR
jgi:hypothetical protein